MNIYHSAEENDSGVDQVYRPQQPQFVTSVEPSESSVPIASSSTSRPSVHTSSFHQQSTFHHQQQQQQQQQAPPEQSNAADDVAAVSADQERQVLLLMLLAQVCALHDPTPKTFTIHVVELFERGILDRESIHFLFELGLVPSLSSPPRRLLTHEDTAQPPPANTSSPYQDETEAYKEIANELALTTTTTSTTTTTTKLSAVFAASNDPQRAAEAYAIRSTLARYEQLQIQQQQQETQKERRNHRSKHDPDPNHEESTEQAAPTSPIKPWDAKHFPLSLSRYKREFLQVAMLASGSFGQVFHVSHKMDGCDYAIKKVDFDATGFSNATIQEVVREVECLAMVSDHVNVVRYYTSWLEPSWMTGGQAVEATTAMANRHTLASGSSSAYLEPQPQHKRLTHRLKNLIQPENDEGRNGVDDNWGADTLQDSSFDPSGSSVETGDSGWNNRRRGSIASCSTRDVSSSNRHGRRRRFSFGSSVDSQDQSWRSYKDPTLEGFERAAAVDTYLGVRSSSPRRRQSSVAAGPKSPPGASIYRYQISMYIQMQLCHSASLADWIRERNTKVPEREYGQRMGPAVEIVQQIVQGLAHVHSKGIIHRDMKPANVFASKDGQVIKIGDFGLSKQLATIGRQQQTQPKHDNRGAGPNVPTKGQRHSEESSSETSQQEHWDSATMGVLVHRRPQQTIAPFRNRPTKVNEPLTAGIGTRSYAAPEQLQTKSYSTAADIFSLGLIFLELVCCFETEHERLDNFHKCRMGQLQPWIAERYPEIGQMVLACTHSDPDQRPSAEDLKAWLPTSSSSPHVAHSAPSAIMTTTLAKMTRRTRTMTAAVNEPEDMGDLHHAQLCQSLVQRDEELAQHKEALAEKDRMIETLQLEMEELRAASLGSIGSTTETADT